MTLFDAMLDRIGHLIARILKKESAGYQPFTPSDPVTLRRVLQPGDVLLVEGNEKIAGVIKYLTQSTWSHAAMYVGDALGPPAHGGEAHTLVEVNLGEGCVAVPLSKYRDFNTRICRPVGLTVADRQEVVRFMVERIGLQYDTRHIFDLLRFLFPIPVPVRWRRRMLALGSGEPTRAICSSLIAQAFYAVRYPILPSLDPIEEHERVASAYSRREIIHIRHHSLYTPRDFDLSPYFAVIKPTIEAGFNYKRLEWRERTLEEAAHAQDAGLDTRVTALLNRWRRRLFKPRPPERADAPPSGAPGIDA